MKRIFYEIQVSKDNEESPAAFELIFVSLHKIFDKYLKKQKNKESFSFEIAKICPSIRFFISSPEKYGQYIKGQIFAHYKNIEIKEVQDYLGAVPNDKIQVWIVQNTKHYLYPIKDFTDIQEQGSKNPIDPFASITAALSQTGKHTITTLQILFHPIDDREWKKDSHRLIQIVSGHYPEALKKVLLSDYYKYLKLSVMPFIGIAKVGKWIMNPHGGVVEHTEDAKHETELKYKAEDEDVKENFLKKISHPGYDVGIHIIHAGEDGGAWRIAIKEVQSTLGVYAKFANNALKIKHISREHHDIQNAKRRQIIAPIVLNTKELTALVHLPTNYVTTPTIHWLGSRSFEPPVNLPIIWTHAELTPLWRTNFRWTKQSFWILPEDRRRHIYIVGKTGMGKSTLLENMIIDDMQKGRWIAVVDPHGDLAEAVIGHIPKSRTNHTIIFDPSDKEWPIAFNMLENIEPEHRPLVTSGLIWIFKKIFWESWWPRLEHTLRNTIMALLEYPNTTLISIPLMLTSDSYRRKVVNKITDPVVKKFWTAEFGKLNPSQRTETISPILNKVGQFLSSPILRNVLGQARNSFSMRWAMDNGKIVIINLSKWKIWEDASSLLWAMLITKFQLDAMSRADIKEKERKDFYLYVDEFQNFATDSFATILSEARKYKLNLVMANQYIDQMPVEVKNAVFGNVGSIISFQIWPTDAKIIKEALQGDIQESDLINAKKYHVYLRELIDGMPSTIFSAEMFPPIKSDDAEIKDRYTKILQVSREKYCKPRALVVEKINKMMADIETMEEESEKYIEAKKAEKNQTKGKK
jgi:Type IV secretion-system coupling protein DNA-binding domain